jgi:putative sterol carrier protein
MRPSMRDTPAEVEAILRSLPGRLRAERVEGYAGVFHFDIVGAKQPQWTVRIDGGSVTVDEGHLGDPACTVTMAEDVFLAIETGQRNPLVAFVKGKIKISNVGHMRRFDRAFHRFHDVPKDEGEADSGDASTEPPA